MENFQRYQSTKKLKILLLEKEPLTQTYLQQQIQELSHDSFVSTLETYQELFQKISFDLVLFEISNQFSSEKDSFFSLRQQTRAKRIPIILLTPTNEVALLEHYLEQGADDYFQIPISSKLLKTKIQNWLQHHFFLEQEKELLQEVEETQKELETQKITIETTLFTQKQIIRKIGHDLRSPLNGVLGYTNVLLKKEKELTPILKQSLEVIQRSGETILKLVNHFTQQSLEDEFLESHAPTFSPTEAQTLEFLLQKQERQSEKQKNVAFKGTILIVDDNPTNLDLLFDLLATEGFQVQISLDGISAIQKIQESPPDLVLLDIMMSGLDGFETCRRLKANRKTKKVPILFMTALNETEEKIKGFELGAVDYITKPFQYEEVVARINTHFTLCRLQQQLEGANEHLEFRVRERTRELQEEIIERITAEKKLRILNQAYGRFVPHEFLRLLRKESIEEVQLGDHIEMTMSVLFSDIRSFTTFSEQMTPEDTFRFINSYLKKMGPLVRSHQGFIDKFIGDAIMALFAQSADSAVEAAIQMFRILEEYNKNRLQKNFNPIQIGIGINTGKLMLGTIGEQDRMEGTVISDAVNLASRLEGLTKIYETPLLISEHTFKNLIYPERYTPRLIDRVQVKGKTEAINIYEILDANTPIELEKKRNTLPLFEKAYILYHQKEFQKARTLFMDCIKQNSQDKAAEVYIERCQHLARVGHGADWKGITRLDTKQLFILHPEKTSPKKKPSKDFES